jgi:uncharacterized membrane protein
LIAGRRTRRQQIVIRIVLFAALLGWCGVMIAFRFLRSGSLAYGFLAWNLFLAAIPAVAAWLYVEAADRRAPLPVRAFWFAVWLVFLPNAPYVLTDFIHLEQLPPIPLWYDIALLASCAGTGLLLGYSSLADVHAAIARRHSLAAGWTLAAAALLASGFGIYLGRVLRWNSWDVLTHPRRLTAEALRELTDPASYLQTIGVTLVYGIALLLGYVALRVIEPLGARDDTAA